MQSHTSRFFIVITLIACSSSLILPMDPPKPQPERGKSTEIKLKWISLVKKILLDQIPLQTESGDALEDEFMVLNDGPDSFKYLKNTEQEAIVNFLKFYISSSNQANETPITLSETMMILRNLFQQNEHLRRLFFDSIFCRQLIKLLAKKFNESELVVTEIMKFAASHQILITQNQLLSLCREEHYSENAFEKELNRLIKQYNADVNFTYFGRKTLLMIVAATEHPSLMRPLIKAGADRFMKDKNGQTAKDFLDEYWPNPLQTLEMPLEYRVALKALMGKNIVKIKKL